MNDLTLALISCFEVAGILVILFTRTRKITKGVITYAKILNSVTQMNRQKTWVWIGMCLVLVGITIKVTIYATQWFDL